MLRYIPFSDRAPDRRVVIAWRKASHGKRQLSDTTSCIACELPGVAMLDEEASTIVTQGAASDRRLPDL